MQLSSKYIISIALSAQILLPFSRDPKKVSSGSADPSLPPAGPLSQDVVSRSADMTLYVVFLPVFPISGRKDRFAYSLILIHFRKILNPIKIGS